MKIFITIDKVRGPSTMICSFEFYFKCLCILLYLPNATVATKDKKALQRNFLLSPSNRHTGTEERKKLRKYDDERKIITKTGSLMYKQPTDHPYVSYEGFGLHMCVEKCLMIGRCNSITYNLQTMKCGLLVALSVTADFRDIETTNTVFTGMNGWRSEDGKRCDATCDGTCRCLKSRKGSMISVRTVESFAVTKGRPFVFNHKIIDMSASILHPGHVYYLKTRHTPYIFMANVRESNAELTTERSKHPRIRVIAGSDIINICVGPKSREMSFVLYGLSSKNEIYHFEEPRRIETYMKQLRVKIMPFSFHGKLYGIHILNGHLCAHGSTTYRGRHLCQLKRHYKFYSCSRLDTIQVFNKLECSQLDFGVLVLVSSKELRYKDATGFKEYNLYNGETRISLYKQPALFIFSLDSSQIYVLFKRDSSLVLECFYRTLLF